jgi:anti-sigma-K factor RskA
MNATPDGHGHGHGDGDSDSDGNSDGHGDDLRYAEYVLGVLDADARAAVAHEVTTNDEAAIAAALWQRRLIPLAGNIEEVAPAPQVWARIVDALERDAKARPESPKGLREGLRLWQWLGIGAGALAASLLVALLLPGRAPTPEGKLGYMVSTMQQDNGVTGWTATMDLQHARMVVVPASPAALAQGRAPELWLIPAGQEPISVGVIAAAKPTTIALDPVMLARLGPTAALAVTAEPIGGSPSGRPTGPVIAKGAITGAPDAPGPGQRVALVIAYDAGPGPA